MGSCVVAMNFHGEAPPKWLVDMFADVRQRVSHACVGFLIGGLGGLFRGIGFSFGWSSAPYICRPGPEKEPLVPHPPPPKVGGMWVPCWVEGAGQDLAI